MTSKKIIDPKRTTLKIKRKQLWLNRINKRWIYNRRFYWKKLDDKTKSGWWANSDFLNFNINNFENEKDKKLINRCFNDVKTCIFKNSNEKKYF